MKIISVSKHTIMNDAVKLTMSKIIAFMISLITAMLLSRFRTLKEYGTYSQIILVMNLTISIFMMGLPNSINFFLARAEDGKEKGRFLSVYYSLSTILSFFTGLILIISAPLIVDYFNNPFIKNFIYVLAILPWTKIILSSIDNILIVYKKTTCLMVFRILNSMFLLLIIWIVEVFNWGFGMYMFLFLIVEVVFTFIVYIIVKNMAGKIKICFDNKMIKTILKFSLPIGLGNIAGTLKAQLDKLVIAGFYDTEQLAIYTNAAREMPITFIVSSITAVLMPRIVCLLKKEDKYNAIRLWSDSISFSYLIICFFSIGIFTYAPEVMTLLYSEKYVSGVPVFRVYSLVLLFRCTYFGIILNSAGKTRAILHSSALALVSNIILNFIFYYLFGFIGPAIATLVATLLSATYLLYATTKTIKIPFKNIFPWKKILYITALNIGFGIAFSLFKQLIPLEQTFGEVIESIILGLIWGFVYILLTFKFMRTKWQALNKG